MKIAERIIGGLVILALILKLLQIPGGSALLIISIGILSIFYVVCSYFIFKSETSSNFDGIPNEKQSPMKVLGSVATGMSLSSTLVGILFKIMHWPGAAVHIIIGLLCLLVIGVISIIKYSKSKSGYYKKIGIRIGTIGLVALILFFIKA